jgi:hypothetical protein
MTVCLFTGWLFLQFTEFVTEIKDMMDKGIDSAMKKHLRKKGAVLMVSCCGAVGLWGLTAPFTSNTR